MADLEVVSLTDQDKVDLAEAVEAIELRGIQQLLSVANRIAEEHGFEAGTASLDPTTLELTVKARRR